jgi:hypothetical protein
MFHDVTLVVKLCTDFSIVQFIPRDIIDPLTPNDL